MGDSRLSWVIFISAVIYFICYHGFNNLSLFESFYIYISIVNGTYDAIEWMNEKYNARLNNYSVNIVAFQSFGIFIMSFALSPISFIGKAYYYFTH